MRLRPSGCAQPDGPILGLRRRWGCGRGVARNLTVRSWGCGDGGVAAEGLRAT
ncbi:hypothetical protein ACFPM0_31070 [Pseudonocardia sulfidoxydans]|uniref:hypothetical protein n=1 Tax=Pseudonocardia sulfidoxydans TaxID=54011 RepID=UPI00360DC297